MSLYQYKQTHGQSCTAVAMMITLAELGLIPDTDINQTTEMAYWGTAKRSSTVGEEEILPSAAIQLLISKGAKTEAYEDTGLTAGLKAYAPTDYAQYETGLSTAKIVRQGKLDPATAFNDNARSFLIVGFMSATKLMTHTVLMRKEGNQISVMNPDGGSETSYSSGEIISFLAGQNAPVTFAGLPYLYTGIAYRVWK